MERSKRQRTCKRMKSCDVLSFSIFKSRINQVIFSVILLASITTMAMSFLSNIHRYHNHRHLSPIPTLKNSPRTKGWMGTKDGSGRRYMEPNNPKNGREYFSPILVKKERQTERRTQRQKLTNQILNLQRSIGRKEYINENEDGYEEMMKPVRPFYRRVMKAPFKLAKRILFPEIAKEPGTLILLRHGESLWNYNKTFTGWADPDLSERGLREAEHAARLLLESGYEIDIVFTSRLKRAIRTLWIILQELNKVYIPVFKSWRLNERMYGALTGLSKTKAAAELGTELVQEWRGSLRTRPPALKTSDPYWPGRDNKYADLSASQIPCTESLLDCMERTIPVWEDKISYELRKGNNVMVVGHANTLRGLVKIIDGIGDDEIQDVTIPTGIPIVYKFDNIKELTPVKTEPIASGNANTLHMNGLFLEKPGLLKEALNREEEWCNRVPGYDDTMMKKSTMSSLESSLTKLQAEREVGEWAWKFINETDLVDEGDDGNSGRRMIFVEDKGMQKSEDEESSVLPSNTSDKGISLLEVDEENDIVSPTMITNNPCQKPLPVNTMIPGMGETPVLKDATIVIIRHGKTEHNKLGLFTGWEDAPLAPEGVEEAKAAGKLLKSHGFEFDLVFTSWLSRAIETALHVVDELDSLWLPMIKTWRLNERMYGELTGLSKQMVKQRHGAKQFMAWRRGYKVRPPPVSSFSPMYPGNDVRYTKFMKDVRLSLSESIIRSIEASRLKVSRKFPKSESLYDCMERTIPYFTQQIEQEANNGKRILISSSENAIRGLLMHLCDIPESEIVGLEIPNGLPLIFDVKSKCVKLLDDGTGRDPLEVYNFGKAGNYLFRPCKNEDGSDDEECDIRWMSDKISDEDQAAVDLITRPRVTKPEIQNV